MSIDDIRMQQRSQQSSAIKSRREVEGVVRIGDRDPITGRYQVLEPDGGIDPNGIKVFNSQEQYGDRVLPFRRIDGAIALDSEKGSKARPPTAFPKCPGYLGNQVFNCEEPPKKVVGKIWILYIYKNQLYVGGHQQDPELIYNPIPSGINVDTAFSALPVNAQNNVLEIKKYAQIWGDDQGWEASYGVNNPAQLLKFATEGETRNGPSTVGFNSQVYLGKGFFARFDELFFNEFFGDTRGQEYGLSWKNTIADFDSIQKNVGSSKSYSRYSNEEVLNSYGNKFEESYPAPYSNKNRSSSYSESSQYFSTLKYPNLENSYYLKQYTHQNLNSFQFIYRDRSQGLLFRVNSAFYSAQDTRTDPPTSPYYPVTADFFVSDGQKDTALFSTLSTSVINPNTSARQTLPSNGLCPTFNFPVVTDLGDGDVPPNPTKYKHLDSEKDYTVRVYDVFSKSSLIDGVFTTVTLSAWGIPEGSQVLYTASYVP